MFRVKATICPLYNQLDEMGKMWESDLQHEVNKSGFHEKDQDVQHRTVPSFQTKILHDGHSVSPGIVLDDEQRNQVFTSKVTCHSLYATIAVVRALVPIKNPIYATTRKLHPLAKAMYQVLKPDGVDNCIT